MKLSIPLADVWPLNGFAAPDWMKRALFVQSHISAMGNRIPTRKIQYPVEDIPPWQDARTIRGVANTRGLVAHPDSAAPYREWVVELARFDVPAGQIGIVKGFEQFLATESLEIDQLFTAICRWGVPFGKFGGLRFDSPLFWRLRLSAFNGQIEPWFDGLGSGVIPGQPYTDMPYTSDLWFPASSPASQNVHFPIPGGNTLRVFLHSTQTDQRLQAALHLKGYRISAASPEARDSIRSYW